MFFNEICITLNKILGKYDNIFLAGDLNIDELKPGSNSSNHLSDAKDVFNLTNLVKKPTCFKLQDGTLIDLMLIFFFLLHFSHLYNDTNVKPI